MNDNWKLPYTVIKPLSFPVSIQSRKYQNPKDIIIRDIKSQKNGNLIVYKLQTTGYPSNTNKNAIRGKWKKPLILRNIISLSNTVHTSWSCFLFPYLEDFSVWFITWGLVCCIVSASDLNGTRMISGSLQLFYSWERENKGKYKLKRKKKKKKGKEQHTWVQKFGEVLGALCSFPRFAPFISNQYWTGNKCTGLMCTLHWVISF